MKPYITKKEVEETQGKDARTQRFLTAENGASAVVLPGQRFMPAMSLVRIRACMKTRRAFMCLRVRAMPDLVIWSFQLKQVIHLLHFRVCRIRLRQNRAVSLSRYFGFTVQSDADCC